MVCLICQCETGQTHSVREMMFGTREVFHYFECDLCSCLSLRDPPNDLSQYYPAEKYYSLGATRSTLVPRNEFRRWLKKYRDRAACLNRGGVAGFIANRYPNEDASVWRNWLRHTSVKSHSARILDVGCGQGWHLSQLDALGFINLTGVDPYLREDDCSGPVKIHACQLSELSDSGFDLITLHHALEHVPNQLDTLHQISRKLAPDGHCMVRIPIVSRGPWKTYGTDWAEIDAPRHFVLHTEMSLKLAAEQAGLSIRCIQYESDIFTYAASELYRRNLSLYDDTQNRQRPLASVFDSAELQQFESMSRAHHIPAWAGRAAFFLTRTSSGEGSGRHEIYSDLRR